MNTAVIPGSFDPLTLGHIDIITRSTKIFDKVVVGVLENSEKQTLFSVEERVELIREDFKMHPSISVTSFSGLLVDFAQQQKAKVIIRGLRAISDFDYEAQMALVNRNLCEDVETFFLITREEYAYISSSIVKQAAKFNADIGKFVSPRIAKALKDKMAKKS